MDNVPGATAKTGREAVGSLVGRLYSQSEEDTESPSSVLNSKTDLSQFDYKTADKCPIQVRGSVSQLRALRWSGPLACLQPVSVGSVSLLLSHAVSLNSELSHGHSFLPPECRYVRTSSPAPNCPEAQTARLFGAGVCGLRLRSELYRDTDRLPFRC